MALPVVSQTFHWGTSAFPGLDSVSLALAYRRDASAHPFSVSRVVHIRSLALWEAQTEVYPASREPSVASVVLLGVFPSWAGEQAFRDPDHKACREVEQVYQDPVRTVYPAYRECSDQVDMVTVLDEQS